MLERYKDRQASENEVVRMSWGKRLSLHIDAPQMAASTTQRTALRRYGRPAGTKYGQKDQRRMTTRA